MPKTSFGLKVPEKLKIYNEIRKPFVKIAEEQAKKFDDDFIINFDNMDDLAENGFSIGLKFINNSIEYSIKELIKNGLYEIDSNLFLEKYALNYFTWESDFQELLDTYFDIVLEEEDAQEYRQSRKDNRSKWSVFLVNGSYTDALSSQAQAGMWNMMEGAGHSIINSIGNAISKKKAEREKEELFDDDLTRENLTESIYNTCLNMHFALIDVLNKEKELNILNYKELYEMQNKAERIFDNIKKNMVPAEEVPNLLLQIFSLNPYNKNYYKCLSDYDIEVKDINLTANYFKVNVAEITFKSLYDYQNEVLSQLNDTDFITARNLVKNAVKEIERLATKQSIALDNPKIIDLQNTLKKKLSNYYKGQVENILYSDKTEEVKYNEIQDIERNVTVDNLDNMLEYIKKEKDKLLTCSGILFDTIEEKVNAQKQDIYLKDKLKSSDFKKNIIQNLNNEIAKMSPSPITQKYKKAIDNFNNNNSMSVAVGKSLPLAYFFAYIFPPLPYFYLKQKKTGFIVLIVFILAEIFLFILTSSERSAGPFLGLSMLLVIANFLYLFFTLKRGKRKVSSEDILNSVY